MDPRPGIYGWIHGSRSNGVTFHRVREPLRACLAADVAPATWGNVLDDDILAQHDTVVVQMLHDERGSEAWGKLAGAGHHRLVLDVDDAMWRPDWTPFRNAYDAAALERLYRNVMLSHVVTTPNPVIAEHLSKVNPNVWVVPNTVPAWVLDIDRSTVDPKTIGYQGSPSHSTDWTVPVRNAVARFVVESGWSITFAGTGDVPEGWPAGTVATPWQDAGSAAYYTGLRFAVGIGPLKPTYFNTCKSGLRAVEYSALGIVPVLPDVDIYRPYVTDGIDGRLVATHQTLRRVLHEVADDAEWTERAGRLARARAATHTTEHNLGRWVEAWSSQ